MTNSLQHQTQLLQDRYGLKVAARLSEGATDLPYDISERLRAARVQAVSRRKIVEVRTASSVMASGGAATLTFGDEGLSWWSSIASALPLIALVSGLVAIHVIQDEYRANEVAEVDAALLTDDLPPAAYADPGFVQFLKTGGNQDQ
ncbi:MAG: DUF3619 family protein [Burkholderiaceae bacterium]